MLVVRRCRWLLPRQRFADRIRNRELPDVARRAVSGVYYGAHRVALTGWLSR
jgi:hypothetical protein